MEGQWTEQDDTPAAATAPVERSAGVQLRTSARVSKKMRHDMETTNVDKKCECTGGSGGLGGGSGSAHDSSGSGVPTGGAGAADGVGTPVGAGGGSNAAGSGSAAPGGGPEEKRRAKRTPVHWSPEDKAAFFEALNENGKKFKAIQKYVMAKAKKRGDHSAKNREQARYFYCSTWLKLAKHIKIPPNVKKVTQELYGLINFGEMRKKVGKITEKNAQKLNELIYCGSTQVRARGKTWRIKTPVCRALRKLNQLEETAQEVKLPQRVEVVLYARDMTAAARVQSVAHNPRCRTVLPLDSPLDALVAYLDARWTQPQLRPTNEGDKQSNGNPKSSSCTNANTLSGGETPVGECDVFTVGPRASAQICRPSYKCGPIVTSSSLSLLAHEKRIGGQHEAVGALLSQLQIGKPKSALLKWQKDCNPVDDGYLDAEVVDPAQTGPAAAASGTAPLPPSAASSSVSPTGITPNGCAALVPPLQPPAVLLSPGAGSGSGPTPPLLAEGAASSGAGGTAEESATEESKEEFEATIRRGWNKTTASRTRIGELYIMFGSNGVVNLDYWWERPALKAEPVSVPAPVPASTPVPAPAALPASPTSAAELSKALAKLISIARLYYTKSKVECPCGHVCRNSVRPQSQLHSKQVKANKLPASGKAKDSAGGVGTKPSDTVNSSGEITNGGVVTGGGVMLMEQGQVAGTAGRLLGVVSVSSATTVPPPSQPPPLAPAPSVVFKQPLLPAPGPSSVVPEAYKTLQQFRPKYCNRRGRGRHKSVVVQRMLPLLPKTNLVGSGGVGAVGAGSAKPGPPVVVTLQVIQQQPQQRFLANQQHQIPTTITQGGSVVLEKVSAPLPPLLDGAKRNDSVSMVTGVMSGEEGCVAVPALCVKEAGGGGGDEAPAPQLGLLSLSLANDDVGSPNTFTGLLGARPGGAAQDGSNGSDGMDDMLGVAAVEVSVGTPPTSPSRILKEGESQWLNSEVSDFSLSSFLGHLESSPLKGLSSGVTGGVQALPCVSEDSRLSADVESHFHSLLAESSLDYTAKFADLAEKIAGRAVTTSGGGGVISDQAAPSVTHAATDPTVGS